MRLTEDRFAYGRENVVVVVVADIKREIAIDALKRARSIQTTSAACAYTMSDNILCEMLDDVTGTAACYLRRFAVALFPQSRNMSEPQISRVHIYRHRGDVMLHVRVGGFVLRSEVLKREVVSCFGGS